MKLFAFLAAGAVVASAVVPAAVSAQDHNRVVRHDRHVVVRHGNNQHYRTRTVCKTVWNHGHRQRVCRQVRR